MREKIRPIDAEKGEVTPEQTKIFLESVPLYREDKENPHFLPYDHIKKMQSEKLKIQLQRVAEGSAYYQRLFKENNINIDDINSTDDLTFIPISTKKEYMANPEDFRLKLKNPTLYDWLWDVTYTTGTTTGVPTPFYNTIHDYYGILLQLKRGAMITGVRPDDITINLFPLGPIPHIGFIRTRDGSMIVTGLSATPCTGMPNPEFPIHRPMSSIFGLIEKYQPDGIIGIGSFLRRVIMEAEKEGRDFSSIIGIQALGEAVPKAMREDMRKRVRNMGTKEPYPFVANSYGFTEMQGALLECWDFSGCHNPAPEQYFFEIVDEKTEERLPDGEEGMVVITHLNRTGTVLIRYAIGDIAAITHEPCPHCGRTSERVLVVTGSTYVTRRTDLIKLKGTLINPEILMDILANVPGVGEYQIIFTKKDLKDPFSPDELLLKIACLPTRKKEEIKDEIFNKVLNAMEMRPKIQFVELSEIFDISSSLKAVRIIDIRPKLE